MKKILLLTSVITLVKALTAVAAPLEVESGSLLDKVGLRQNDKILSYDNHLVDSIQDSMELYDKLKRDEVNYLTIERDGKRIVVAGKSSGSYPEDTTHRQEVFPQIGVQKMMVMKIEDRGVLETKDLDSVDSEQKAMELYNTLKSTDATQLQNDVKK